MTETTAPRTVVSQEMMITALEERASEIP
jgi:hypothetical protein